MRPSVVVSYFNNCPLSLFRFTYFSFARVLDGCPSLAQSSSCHAFCYTRTIPVPVVFHKRTRKLRFSLLWSINLFVFSCANWRLEKEAISSCKPRLFRPVHALARAVSSDHNLLTCARVFTYIFYTPHIWTSSGASLLGV